MKLARLIYGLNMIARGGCVIDMRARFFLFFFSFFSTTRKPDFEAG